MAVDPLSRVCFILRAIEHAQSHISHLTVETFPANHTAVEATLFDLAVIGKAARLLPDDFVETHPTIPWRELAGLSDIVINHCMNFEFHPRTIWNTVEYELTPMVPHLQAIVANGPPTTTMATDKGSSC